MARIFTEGFECGDLLNGIVISGINAAVSTTQKRTGSYALSVNGSTGGFQKTITASDEFYFRIPIYTPNNGIFFKWRKGTTELGSLRINAVTRYLEIYTSTGTLVATGTLPITINTWYLIEAWVKIADSGGVITAKIDGTQNVTFTGDTKPGADTQIDNVQYVIVSGGAVAYFDDLAINDTSGAVDNSWCGDGRIIALTPNGNGDLSQLTGSDGNSTDNYLLVDEVPSNGDTDYVEGSVVNDKDLYNLSACGLSSVTIQRVWAEARSRDTVGAGGLIALTIKTNSTEYASGDIALATSYAAVLGTEYLVNPNTSAAWSTTDLDALQVGPKTRS